jgi:hypothetical protein
MLLITRARYNASPTNTTQSYSRLQISYRHERDHMQISFYESCTIMSIWYLPDGSITNRNTAEPISLYRPGSGLTWSRVQISLLLMAFNASILFCLHWHRRHFFVVHIAFNFLVCPFMDSTQPLHSSIIFRIFMVAGSERG